MYAIRPSKQKDVTNIIYLKKVYLNTRVQVENAFCFTNLYVDAFSNTQFLS